MAFFFSFFLNKDHSQDFNQGLSTILSLPFTAERCLSGFTTAKLGTMWRCIFGGILFQCL